MLKQILDFHIHSKYSRACSPDLELPKIAAACARKGVDIVATGDFTHPAWLGHIKENLSEIGESGLYELKNPTPCPSPNRGGIQGGVKFILSTEISCIYKHQDKTRRLHLVILAPNIAAVEKLNAQFEKKSVNLKSDGRPIMGLSAKAVLQMLLEIDERFLLIPAHAWTPWFAVFGSKSGYDSLTECFEELTPHIRAIETGLSSDPAMNRRLSKLDNITLVSNSDAHSPDKIGREANAFAFAEENEITYGEITRIIKEGDKRKFLHTIEFFPEEGKYHFDGHAACEVCLAPKETKKLKNICPKCKKNLTVGVLHRVDDLADREEENIPAEKFIPHKYVVPLREIIAAVFGVGTAGKKVALEYENLIKNIGSEFHILLDADLEEIKKYASDKNIALAIANARVGRVKVKPGYDGVFGTVNALGDREKMGGGQSRLF
ncbi:DNA helicase UvrD [Patescibacteria group bacterium]|nr:MAG: DNA helicase UvrD [Patescibacteria group bacterium]